MSIEYADDKALNQAVSAIMDDKSKIELNIVREQELKVVPVMKVKTNKDGEHEQNSGAPAKIMKVNELMKFFTDAHYLLIVDYHFFNHSSETARDAILFNALMEMDVTAEEGKIKLASKEPDIQLFSATIKYYGAFDTCLLALREWMNAAKTAAAKSFVAKISTGKLEEDSAQPPSREDDPEDPPHIRSGLPEDEDTTKKRRGGRNKR